MRVWPTLAILTARRPPRYELVIHGSPTDAAEACMRPASHTRRPGVRARRHGSA
jgi:hypothetical protein